MPHPCRSLLLVLTLFPWFATACSTGTSDAGTAGGDPALDRGTFWVEIDETIADKDDDTRIQKTDRNVSQELITRKLLLHGYRLAKSRAEARYVIEGTLHAKFHKTVTFNFQGQETLLEEQYEASFHSTLTDTTIPETPAGTEPDAAQPPRVEKIDIPFLKNGRTEDYLARLDIRRMTGTKAADRIANGPMLGNSEVRRLLMSLGDVYEERTFNEVIGELQKLGYAAVPYLIDSMTDDRPVRLTGKYPALADWNKDSLKYYHVADKALEEILNRTSGLDLDSDERYRLRVRLGWTWAWEDIQVLPASYREGAERRKSSVKAGSTKPETPPTPEGQENPEKPENPEKSGKSGNSEGGSPDSGSPDSSPQKGSPVNGSPEPVKSGG